MKRINISETTKYIGKKVKVCGWVHSRRDHGKLIFIDLRDRSGLLQIVFVKNKEAEKLRPEWVVEIQGTINKRPSGMINKELTTGTVELKVEELKILNEAETPPFEINEDSKKIKKKLD